jgi:hypothetical protein
MSSLPKNIEDELQFFLKLLIPNVILLRCLHGEEQHLRGNLDQNIKATPFVQVKVEIKQGQGSISRFGLGLDA